MKITSQTSPGPHKTQLSVAPSYTGEAEMIHAKENLKIKNIISNFSKIREESVSMKQEHKARVQNSQGTP